MYLRYCKLPPLPACYSVSVNTQTQTQELGQRLSKAAEFRAFPRPRQANDPRHVLTVRGEAGGGGGRRGWEGGKLRDCLAFWFKSSKVNPAWNVITVAVNWSK